ncbi:MAG: DUF488 domain-containing protein [Chitinophagales bacterium]|nr:DUF488 domain-containing protein [Chitinophagales bacterium]
MKGFIIKRIYEPPSENDGYRILIDRLWPRGISKSNARVDEWDKDLAPSTELRKWFNHEVEKFEKFTTQYRKELEVHTSELQRLNDLSKTQQICLLYGAKDELHNQAVVLKSVLESL